MAELKNTDTARVIDQNGRVVIPSKVRTEYRLKPGFLCEFYVTEIEGRKYLCFPMEITDEKENDELEWALRVLEKHGIEI